MAWSLTGPAGGAPPTTTTTSPRTWRAAKAAAASPAAPRQTSSCTLVSSRTTATRRPASTAARSANVAATRPGASSSTVVRPSAMSDATRSRRSLPFRGRNPSTQKRSVGRPLITSAATTEVGPGTMLTSSPASESRETSNVPGSEMPGVPASLTTATVPPSATHACTRSTRAPSLCPCRDKSRSPCDPPAGMPIAERRALVRRVSSQQIRSATSRTCRARVERSPRFPMGVATRTNRPRWTPRRVAHSTSRMSS